MFKLIRFEMNKIMKSVFNRVFVLLLFLCLIGFYVFVYEKTVRPEEIAMEKEEMVNMLEESFEEEKLAYGEELNAIEKQELAFSEVFLERERNEFNGYLNQDWETVLTIEIDRMSPGLEGEIMSRRYYTSSFPTLFTEETRMEFNKYLRDNAITPVLRLDFFSWNTIYDELYPIGESDHDEDYKELIEERAAKYSSVGVGFIRHVSDFLFSFYGVALFILFFGDVVTREGIGRNGPIHLLQTQPVAKNSILISKFLATLLATVVIFVGIGSTSLLLGTIFDGMGDWRYPILVYGEDYAYEFMATSTYLLKTAALFMMFLLFSYALLFLYSMITKRMIIAVGLTLATMLLGIQLGNEAIDTSFGHWIPFHYLDASKIITMEQAVSLKDFNFDFSTGMIVLTVASVILLLLTYMIAFWQNRYKGA